MNDNNPKLTGLTNKQIIDSASPGSTTVVPGRPNPTTGRAPVIQPPIRSGNNGPTVAGEVNPGKGKSVVPNQPAGVPRRPVSSPVKTNEVPGADASNDMFVGSVDGILSAEEARKMGIAKSGKVADVSEMRLAEEKKKYAESQRQIMSDLADMFTEAEQGEKDRLQRMENTMHADEATKERLLGDTVGGTVHYDGSAPADNAPVAPTVPETEKPAVELYDMTPAYTDDDTNTDNGPSVDDTIPEPDDEHYGEYIRSLATVESTPDKEPAVRKIRDITIQDTPTDKPYKARSQTLGDQAFTNAITKFKKDHFGKVTVLLPNSGFFVDMVGTGVSDLTNLYLNVDRDMTMYDYQLEQMRTVIRNVVGTTPKVSATSLTQMIHYKDFNMMAYGFICATLDKVETVTNCSECGKPFHIVSRPNDLILNQADFSERWKQVESANNVEQFSLMTHDRTVHTTNGIDVILGHPSYAEVVNDIRNFQEYSKKMTDANRRRFETMLDDLYMVRRVRLPNGVQSNNIYQSYQALMLLTQEDLTAVTNEIHKMNEDVMEPRFGIKNIKCPHCHQLIPEIPYTNLFELVFYHTTVSGFRNNPES